MKCNILSVKGHTGSLLQKYKINGYLVREVSKDLVRGLITKHDKYDVLVIDLDLHPDLIDILNSFGGLSIAVVSPHKHYLNINGSVVVVSKPFSVFSIMDKFAETSHGVVKN